MARWQFGSVERRDPGCQHVSPMTVEARPPRGGGTPAASTECSGLTPAHMGLGGPAALGSCACRHARASCFRLLGIVVVLAAGKTVVGGISSVQHMVFWCPRRIKEAVLGFFLHEGCNLPEAYLH